MNKLLMCGAALIALSSNALAIDDSPSPRERPQRQSQTETWLQLQASGAAASTIRQTSTPSERDLSLQRWLDTYKHPIPPFYEQESGGSFSSDR
ncbi:DUF3613 domain-containing protein [Pseudomonas viridiflava]|uniref:DUF3613 domain-containing protein n=1 Tax=Pseudomonas viridiflava TaxID=33069 RepID=A0A3M5NX33_PSEVI|nr:DUF3613 domain-containing protein [Pseudomonas viridiflava]RMT76752.1 hypothetical protein ALP40_03819 [Pseudomonas viridiflava]